MVLVVLLSNDRLGAGERNTLDSAQVKVLEPGDKPEVEVVEADGSLLISTNEVLVVNSHEDIEGRVGQLNNLDESLLVVITDSRDKHGLVPDEDISFFGTGNGLLSSRDVHGLGVVNFEFILSGEIALLDRGRVGLELAALGSPRVEQDTRFTVTDDFVVLVGVEFNPELVLVGLGSQELDGADRALLFLVSPVPKRHGLISVSSEGDNVLVISREIHVGDTIWVRVEVSADGSSSSGIPDNEHRVFTGIGSDHPSLVLRASDGCNLIAMTLEESLSLVSWSVIVDDTGMSGGIENFLTNMLNLINCHLRFCHFHRR